MTRFLAFLILLLGLPAAAAATDITVAHKGSYTVTTADRLIVSGAISDPKGDDLVTSSRANGTKFLFANGKGGRNEFNVPGAPTLRYAGRQGNSYIYVLPTAAAAPAPRPEPEPTPVPAPATTRGIPPLVGVTLSGCEFRGVPGALCPNVDDVNWYVAAGFRMLRIPVHDDTPMAAVMPAIDRALALGATVIIDRHEYKAPPPAEQVTYWARWSRYNGNPKIIFDTMNEPRGFDDPVLTNDWMQWARDTNLVIAGMRKAGVTNTLLVEWPSSSGIWRFDKSEPAYKACESAGCALDRSGGLVDPLKTTLVSPHAYLDKNGSGTSNQCGAYQNFGGFAVQARKRGLRAIVGESAFGNWTKVQPSCQRLAAAALADIAANADVYDGVTWWGGGRAWPDSYMFKIEPAKGTRSTAPMPSYLKLLMGK